MCRSESCCSITSYDDVIRRYHDKKKSMTSANFKTALIFNVSCEPRLLYANKCTCACQLSNVKGFMAVLVVIFLLKMEYFQFYS